MFDRRLGPATRRLGYFHALRGDPAYVEELLTAEVPAWEAGAVRILGSVLPRILRFGLKIDEAGVARSTTAIEAVFATVNERTSASPTVARRSRETPLPRPTSRSRRSPRQW